jgi:hypothetical protein
MQCHRYDKLIIASSRITASKNERLNAPSKLSISNHNLYIKRIVFQELGTHCRTVFWIFPQHASDKTFPAAANVGSI